MRITVSVELSGSVMNGIAAGHGVLSSVACGLAEGLEGARIGRGAVFVDRKLVLKRLDGFKGGAFGSGARVLEAKGQREPDDGPDAGNDNDESKDQLCGAAFFRFAGSGSGRRVALVGSAIGTDGAGGVDGALAIGAEVHAEILCCW